jgi:hypothetical protein
MNDDEKVAQSYRQLGSEEPPRALDDAILAAARHPRAGGRRSVRPWSRRWAVPLSIAAVLVLSVTVTLRMQYEQPGIESPVRSVPPVAQPAPSLAKESAPAAPPPVAQAQPRPKAAPQRQKPEVQKEPEPFANTAQDKVAENAPPSAAAAPASAGMLSSRRDAAESAAAPAVAQMRAPTAKAALVDTPERELERIAGLRHLGMHDEADKALAEFRKRFPDYAIPEAMRARVERR